MKTNRQEHQTLFKYIFLSTDASGLYLKPEHTF